MPVVDRFGWAEWSVENLTPANDVEAWYETNPSLGTILTERKIRAEITTDDIDFNIQRLGLWLKYNQKSAISKTEWESLAIASKPKLKGELFVGVKYGHDGQHVAMSVASKTNEGKFSSKHSTAEQSAKGTTGYCHTLRK